MLLHSVDMSLSTVWCNANEKRHQKDIIWEVFNVLWADRGLGFSVAKPKPVVQDSQLEQRKKNEKS